MLGKYVHTTVITLANTSGAPGPSPILDKHIITLANTSDDPGPSPILDKHIITLAPVMPLVPVPY